MYIGIACVLSYLLGSVPNGLLLGRGIWHVDLREHGSQNIGATNAWRTLGKTAGFSIFALDLLKGALSVWLGLYFSGTPVVMVICGILAIAGHSWSVFLGFKGGKGVATGLGVILMLMPMITAIVFAVWFVIVYWTRYVSLASIVAAALVPVLAFCFGSPIEYICFGLVAAFFVIYRHKSNISRLLAGSESKIKAAERK